MIPIKIQCECGQKYAFDVEPSNGRMPSRVGCPACGADGTMAANEYIARQLAPVVAVSHQSPIHLVSLPPAVAIATAPPPVRVAPPPMPVVAATAPHPVRVATEPTPIAPQLNPQPVRLATESMPAVATTSPHPTRLAISANPAHLEQPTAPPRVTPPPGRRPDPRLGQVSREQAVHEARAKAMWGDTKDQITGYLLGQGFSYPEALEEVELLFKERASAVRANGIRKIITGFGLMCLPVITGIIFLMIHFFIMYIMAGAVMAGLYGMWQFINGILMAVSPKSDKTSVAEQ